MTSTYQYITLANFESFTGKDYSGIDARYVDGVVEMWITTAEECVIAWQGVVHGVGAAPPGCVAAVKQIAARVATNTLIADGHIAEAGTAQQTPYITLPESDMRNLLGPRANAPYGITSFKRYHFAGV